MKFKMFASLLVVASLGLFATSANAQDVVAQSDICEECEGGVVGAGIGGGIAGSVAGARARMADRRTQRVLKIRNHDVVEASPFAAPTGEPQDWQRFRHYPYAYYPQNFNAQPNMSLQKFNPAWQNYYPVPRRFHEGKHFILDVF